MKIRNLCVWFCVALLLLNCFSFTAIAATDADTDTMTVTSLMGDVNADGTVSSSDYLALSMFLQGSSDIKLAAAADVNGDNSVTGADLATMGSFFAGAVFNFSSPVKTVAVDGVLKINVDSDCCGIVGYTHGYKGMVIPSTYNSLPISYITNDVFAADTALESVTFPSEITSIGAGAFAGCTSLSAVTFSDTSCWQAGDTVISAAELADPATAALYLTSTYTSVAWTKTAHTYGSWTVTLQPTSSTAGEKARVCTACGDKETAVVPATGDLPFTLTYTSGTENCYTYDGTTLTFTAIDAITEYAIEGEMTGNIVVNVGETYKFTLEMRGFTLNCDSTNPIMALSADEFELQAKSGTDNYIYDLRETVDTTDETLHPAAIYSWVDMEISGKGNLNLISENNKGIHSKDDLQVKNLNLAVTCEDNALRGNDSVEITSANTTLIAKTGDCIKTTNSHISATKGEQKGNIIISGGTHNLYAACDGIDAAFNAQVDTVTTVLNIYTDKYSPHSEEVTAVSEATYYLRYTNTYYKYSVRYSNSTTGEYLWVNASDNYETVTSSGMRPGSSGTTYYYYTFPQKADYDKLAVYMYSSTQTQGQDSDYYACSSEKSVNSSYDTVAITYSSSNNSLSVNWTNYTTTSAPGMGGDMGGGMNEGNTDKGTYSTKGIKAFNEIIINSGTINIQAYDDAIHANNDGIIESGVTPTGNVTINAGTVTVSSNDDGVHADGVLTVIGGTVKVTSSYEGFEGSNIVISGGDVSVTSSDDGFNSTATSGAGITISNGNVYVYAKGDGLDSNSTTSKGAIIFSGGQTVVVCNSNGNASIDSDGGYTHSGGKVLALMPRGGMTGEATNGNSIGMTTASSVSLTSGGYATVTVGGTTVLTLKMPCAMTAHAVYLGSSGATISSATSSSATLDSNGVCWN